MNARFAPTSGSLDNAAMIPASTGASPVRRKLRTLARFAVAINLFMAALLAYDVLVTGRGIDAFQRFDAVPGRVIASGIERVVEASSDGERSTWLRGYITYRYDAAGKWREQKRFLLLEHPARAGFEATEERSRRIHAGYRKGLLVAVFVAKDDPDLAYLEPGWYVIGRCALALLPGWILAMAGIGAIWFALVKDPARAA